MVYFDNHLFVEQNIFYSPFSITCFLFFSTLIVYSVIYYLNKVLPDKAGFAFLGFGMLKMFAAIVFLIPLIQSEEVENKIPAVLFFFVPYFIVLFVETLFVVKMINRKDKLSIK